ncbi:hypothetical protein Btru_077618 [Bulinus truncatus]|nr:hypothetical protein Btru_077618 [Bulinus truncatus]
MKSCKQTWRELKKAPPKQSALESGCRGPLLRKKFKHTLLLVQSSKASFLPNDYGIRKDQPLRFNVFFFFDKSSFCLPGMNFKESFKSPRIPFICCYVHQRLRFS